MKITRVLVTFVVTFVVTTIIFISATMILTPQPSQLSQPSHNTDYSPNQNPPYDPSEVDYNWWVGKQYKSESGDIFQAVYHKSNNVLVFCSVKTGVRLITKYDRLPDIGTSDDENQILRYSREIRNGNKLINSTYVAYYPESDAVVMLDLQGNVCDTYKFYQTIESQDTPDGVSTNEAADTVRYESYDTPYGHVILYITGLNLSEQWVDLCFTCEDGDYTIAVPRAELQRLGWMNYKYVTDDDAIEQICLLINVSQLDWSSSGDLSRFNGIYTQLPDTDEQD